MGFFIGVTFDTKKDVQEFRKFVDDKLKDEDWKDDWILSIAEDPNSPNETYSLEFTVSDREDYHELNLTYPPQAFKWKDDEDISLDQFFRNCAYVDYIMEQGGFTPFTKITDFQIAFDIWREMDDYYTDSICTAEEAIYDEKHKSITKKDRLFILI